MITETGSAVIHDAGSTMSWRAVAAGTIASLAISLLLITFGAGMGFAVVSPWQNSGVSPTTFTIGAGLFLIVVAMLSSTIGGYIAGRVRAQWSTVHEHERYFRDTAHGFTVWALATVLMATALAGATSSIISGIGSVTGQAAQAAPGAVYIDNLLRPATPAAAQSNAGTPPADAGSPAPAATTPATNDMQTANRGGNNGNDFATRGEINRILTPSLRKGGAISAGDKTYLAQVVASRTGMSQADAQKRVDEVTNRAKADADAARKSAAAFAMWLAISMLAGALSASLAATEGGNLRNREWYLTK